MVSWGSVVAGVFVAYGVIGACIGIAAAVLHPMGFTLDNLSDEEWQRVGLVAGLVTAAVFLGAPPQPASRASSSRSPFPSTHISCPSVSAAWPRVPMVPPRARRRTEIPARKGGKTWRTGRNRGFRTVRPEPGSR